MRDLVVVRRPTAIVLLVCAVFTLGGYLLKAQCRGAYDEKRNTHYCVNDFQVLYNARGLIEKEFPYVQGAYEEGQLTGATVEYPALTGVLAWVPSLFVDNDADYLTASAILLAPFSLLTAWLLVRLARWKALLYAAAPPLVWYSFHNWDLPVIAATVTAFWFWSRRRWTLAAVALAIGASLKLWPGFFLAPLVLHRLRQRDWSGAATIAVAGIGTWLAVNGPLALINVDGWFAPYAFQKDRAADVTSNTIWFWGFPQLSTAELNVLIPVLLAGAFTVALASGWVRSHLRHDDYPFVQVCGAMLVAFMLLNKAHSPQFTLWLLPFFVLLKLRWGWYVGYLFFDFLLFTGLFAWYDNLINGVDFSNAKQATVIGVWGRAAMLALLFVVFLRARAQIEPDDVDPAPDGPADERVAQPQPA